MNIVALLVAMLIPVVNTYAFEGLQKLLGFVDRLPGLAKACIAILLPLGLNMLAAALKIPSLPGDLHGWGPEIMLSLLQGLVSIGIHEKQKQAALSNPEVQPLT